MLGNSYFDGSRALLFQSLVQEALGIMHHVKKDTVDISRQDVDMPDKEMQRVEKVCGKDYLIPFAHNAELIEIKRGAYVKYVYPSTFYEKDKDVEIERKEYVLDYNTVTLTSEIVRDVQIVSPGGSFPNDGYVPPAVMSTRISGQQKLIVDAVLSADAMIQDEKKSSYKVLVIGCSSPNGVKSGYAYTTFPYMFNAVVDMYDPYDVTREYTVVGNFTVNYRVYGRKFNYNSLRKGDRYDLIIDDSWVKGQDRNFRDPDDLVTTALHYSVKQFPWERGRKGNIYYQKFKTDGCEERRVSRDVQRFSKVRSEGLGVCVMCLELRMRLLNVYQPDFYLFIMSLHNKNCVTQRFEKLDMASSYSGWIKVQPFLINYDEYCCLNCDYFVGAQMVSINVSGISDMKFIFSSRDAVPSRIVLYARQVLVYEMSTDSYYVNKIVGETKLAAEVCLAEGSVNLSHSQSGRNARDKKKKR